MIMKELIKLVFMRKCFRYLFLLFNASTNKARERICALLNFGMFEGKNNKWVNELEIKGSWIEQNRYIWYKNSN